MVTVLVCSKLNQAENQLFLQIKSGEFLIFCGHFNKTIIPLVLVGYEMVDTQLISKTHLLNLVIRGAIPMLINTYLCCK